MEERLQKIIARAGISSRRQAEELITAGRVTVNGVPARELGAKADLQKDEVKVDGVRIRAEAAPIHLALHKPEGFVTTTSDPEGRPTVMDLVRGLGRRAYPVGRLDFNSSGLIILTNDGDLARFLTHPSSKLEKTYRVKVSERISPENIAALAKGPKIGGRPLQPARVHFVKPSRSGRHCWLELTITEGRTHQVRRMCQAVGHDVLKLKRTAIGPVKLKDLPRGACRPLTGAELAGLRRAMANAPEPDKRPPRPAKKKPRPRPSPRPRSRTRA